MNIKLIKKMKALFISSIVLCGTTAFASSTDANNNQQQATQDNQQEQQGVVQFIAQYDSSITPKKGDIYIITYGIGENKAQMEIDASLVANNAREINMPNAQYTIFSIEAKDGNTNKDIPYATNNQFVVSSNNKSEIKIYIGENSVKNVVDEYAIENLIIKNYTPQVPQPTPSYDTPSFTAPSIVQPSEEIQEPSDIETTPSAAPSDTSSEVPSETVSEQPSVEDDETNPSENPEEEQRKKEEHKKSLITRGIVFLVLASISFAGLLIGHKIGKF